MATISWDYCFMGSQMDAKESSKDTNVTYVSRDHVDRWITSHPVRRKGAEKQAVEADAKDLYAAGYSHFIFKSDGERALKALKRAAVEKYRQLAGTGGEASKEIRVIYEESAYGESQQNAHAERAIWEVEGMARTLVFACEDMHGMKTQPDHPLRVWAIEYAGQLLSRAQKSTRDGRTAWELRKGGRSYNRELPAFGEAIIFLKVPKRMMKLPKFEDRWDTGVCSSRGPTRSVFSHPRARSG